MIIIITIIIIIIIIIIISNFASIFSLDKGRDCLTIKGNNLLCSFVVNSKGLRPTAMTADPEFCK